jgi:hypothetical protein
MNIEHWWKDIVRKNWKTRRQTGPSDTVSNMDPTLTVRKLNPFYSGKRPETKHQSRGTGEDIKEKWLENTVFKEWKKLDKHNCFIVIFYLWHIKWLS